MLLKYLSFQYVVSMNMNSTLLMKFNENSKTFHDFLNT